jgi:hypothetical protein
MGPLEAKWNDVARRRPAFLAMKCSEFYDLCDEVFRLHGGMFSTPRDRPQPARVGPIPSDATFAGIPIVLTDSRDVTNGDVFDLVEQRDVLLKTARTLLRPATPQSTVDGYALPSEALRECRDVLSRFPPATTEGGGER